VRVMTGLLANIEVKEDVCRAAASDASLLATDLADHLVSNGLAFREAHHVVGKAVAAAEAKGVSLDKLTPTQMAAIHPALNGYSADVFSLDRAMQRRTLPGSPGLTQVKQQLGRWKKILTSPKRR